MLTPSFSFRLPYVESVIYDEFLVIFIMPDIITIEQARFDIVRLTGLAAYDFNLIPTDGKYRTEYSEGNKDYRGNRGQQIGYVIKGGTVVSFVLGAPVRVDGKVARCSCFSLCSMLRQCSRFILDPHYKSYKSIYTLLIDENWTRFCCILVQVVNYFWRNGSLFWQVSSTWLHQLTSLLASFTTCTALQPVLLKTS